ncbi:hypothetical protein CMU81_00935 [Elizabethkingia anophelis]|nr:hypothetical protein [Elizabethkingia anophelis]MDV4025719.1 hypothetical protein [Elizabethkingia anophelis]
MAKSLEEILVKKKQQLAQAFRDMPAIAGEEIVNHALQNFEDQGYNGDSFEAWQKRKNPTAWGKKDDTSRALLVKSGKGKRSIRISKLQQNEVTVSAGGADVPYMKVHNEGFEGTVKQNVGEHTRKSKDGNKIKVSAFTRTIHQQIPKRKFIGSPEESSQLRNRIKRLCLEEIRKVIES